MAAAKAAAAAAPKVEVKVVKDGPRSSSERCALPAHPTSCAFFSPSNKFSTVQLCTLDYCGKGVGV